MKRLLTATKYMLTELCGLLAVAWVTSWFFYVNVKTPAHWPKQVDSPEFTLWGSDLELSYDSLGYDTTEYTDIGVEGRMRRIPLEDVRLLGEAGIDVKNIPDHWTIWKLWVPIPAILTLLVPLAIGPFVGFRFPLWSGFAWTALIAAELVYYLAVFRQV